MSSLKSGKKKSVFREYVEAILVAVLLAMCIRTFVVQAFKIPSGSMLPTLLVGDYLLVNKFIYGIKNPFNGDVLIPIAAPERGDVVVFRYPKDPSIDYIKRVVGVPGDKIEIKNKQVYINGEKITDSHAWISSPETVLPESESRRDNLGRVVVPKGQLFVMGDNRDNSYDSRFWGFVDQKKVLGQAFILYWSWDMEAPLLSLERFRSIRFGRIAKIID